MVKWSETSENVLRQLQIVQIQHTYVISSEKNLKNRTFWSYPFKKFPALGFFGIFKIFLTGFHCMYFTV
jgi:hypothetical protein